MSNTEPHQTPPPINRTITILAAYLDNFISEFQVEAVNALKRIVFVMETVWPGRNIDQESLKVIIKNETVEDHQEEKYIVILLEFMIGILEHPYKDQVGILEILESQANKAADLIGSAKTKFIKAEKYLENLDNKTKLLYIALREAEDLGMFPTLDDFQNLVEKHLQSHDEEIICQAKANSPDDQETDFLVDLYRTAKSVRQATQQGLG
jgi:hypothetical protein